MARTKGAIGRKTHERADILRRVKPSELNNQSAALLLGLSVEAAGRVLSRIRKFGLLDRIKPSHGNSRCNVITHKETLPADSLTPEQLERARMLRIDPARFAWLLSCPRGERVQHRCRIGWRNGAAIG